MASPKTCYHYISGNHHNTPIINESIFEFDETDVWNVARSPTPKKTLKISKKTSPATTTTRSAIGGTASSLPVNVPDWSKILKEEKMCFDNCNGEYDDFEDGEYRIPPHEYIAKKMARTRIASFSVHEGIGRTLKGRDLSRVRNAIWEKTGFQD